MTLWRDTTDKIGCKKTLNVFIPLRNGQIVVVLKISKRKTSCSHFMSWVAGVCFCFFNKCVFKWSFSEEIEEACFNKSRGGGGETRRTFRLPPGNFIPNGPMLMFWMRTSRLAWSAHGLKGFIVFWQRGRWQRSVPVNNVPILWRLSASPEICRVLKNLVYPDGWSACDTVFCPLPLHSWVTGGGGVGWGGCIPAVLGWSSGGSVASLSQGWPTDSLQVPVRLLWEAHSLNLRPSCPEERKCRYKMLSVSINRETYIDMRLSASERRISALHCIYLESCGYWTHCIICHITLRWIILSVVQIWFVFLLFV